MTSQTPDQAPEPAVEPKAGMPLESLKPAKHTRKALYVSGAGLVAVLAVAGGAAAYFQEHKNSDGSVAVSTSSPASSPSAAATPVPTPTATPTPVTALSHLSDVPVTPGTEFLRPLAVMIENTPEARPQAGLGEADLVYEAIAEGGITRFMALYGNAATSVKVGPVRSARPYYVDLAHDLGALYAHAGGSQLGLAEIKNTGSFDLDGLAIGNPIFYRWNPHNVASEHTLYTTTDALWHYATATKGQSTAGTYASWLFKPAAPAAAPTATKISVSVSAAAYAVQWDYDAASNSYLRSEGGAAHIDMNTGKQISVKNVVLQTTVRADSHETYGTIVKPISLYTLTGSGSAVIFQDGVSIKATWKKDAGSRTRYYDATTGAELSFVPGETWVQLVEANSRISY